MVVKTPGQASTGQVQTSKSKVEPIRKTPSVRKTIEEVNKISRSRPELPVQEELKPENHIDQVQEPIGENISFTREQLSEAWKSFSELIKTESALSYSVVSNIEPDLSDNQFIVISFASNMQLELYRQNIKDILVRHLKKQLGVSSVLIEEKIEERQSDKKVKHLTDGEKFRYLAEKYPNLNVLRNTFNLDFD